MVAHNYNPNYLGVRGWEGHSLRPIPAKMLARLHLNQQAIWEA
jgi:hypothetical protein